MSVNSEFDLFSTNNKVLVPSSEVVHDIVAKM